MQAPSNRVECKEDGCGTIASYPDGLCRDCHEKSVQREVRQHISAKNNPRTAETETGMSFHYDSR